MKNTILSTILFVCFNALNGQVNVNLVFNPANNVITGVTDLDLRQTYRFNLTGVNTAIHSISIKPNARVLKTDLPKGLESLLPFFTNNIVASTSPLSFVQPLGATPAAANTDPFLNAQLTNYFALSTGLDQVLQSYRNQFSTINAAPNNIANSTTAFNVTIGYIDALAGLVGHPPVLVTERKVSIAKILLLTASRMEEIINVMSIYIPNNPGALSDVNALSNFVLAKTEQQLIQDFKSKIPAIAKNISDAYAAQNFEVSLPYLNSKDFTDLDIVIVNKFTGDTIYKENLEFFTREGWKLDFSTGFFYSNIYSNAYYLESTSGVAQIKKETKENYDIAIGASAHFTYRFASNFKAGPTVGVGTSFFDAKLKYLFGGALIFGRKNQICLLGGMAVGQAKLLSGQVSEDNINPNATLPVGITSIPTFDKYITGYFLGLTFNLTSKKE